MEIDNEMTIHEEFLKQYCKTPTFWRKRVVRQWFHDHKFVNKATCGKDSLIIALFCLTMGSKEYKEKGREILKRIIDYNDGSQKDKIYWLKTRLQYLLGTLEDDIDLFLIRLLNLIHMSPRVNMNNVATNIMKKRLENSNDDNEIGSLSSLPESVKYYLVKTYL